MRIFFAIIACVVAWPAIAWGQEEHTEYKPIQLSDKFFAQIDQTLYATQSKLDYHTARYKQRIFRLQQKLKHRIARKDTAASRELYINTIGGWQQVQQLSDKVAGNAPYIPFLDTLHTSLRFLQQPAQLLSNPDMAARAQVGMAHIQALENQLQQAEDIKQMLHQQELYWRDKLQSLGFAKTIKKLNKQIYYYNQQVNEYKELLKHPERIERKAIDLLSKTKVFQDFMRRYSRLATLFRLPGSEEDMFSGISYASLQTREQVAGIIQQQIAAGGPNAQQQFQQQVQMAQAELGKLKDKLLSAGESPGDAPNFKPNPQKTKTFKKRLELGTNIQSQRASNYFPVTTDLGISLGYKLNAKSVAGIGASYKIGWGRGWNDINITHQGAGIRSFIDWKIKNSFWCSGGFEMNYRVILNDQNVAGPLAQNDLGNTVWQQSGLIGLSKKYQAGKKFSGKVQLLWDFLSYRQIPRAQPIVCRIGYDLK